MREMPPELSTGASCVPVEKECLCCLRIGLPTLVCYIRVHMDPILSETPGHIATRWGGLKTSHIQSIDTRFYVFSQGKKKTLVLQPINMPAMVHWSSNAAVSVLWNAI